MKKPVYVAVRKCIVMMSDYLRGETTIHGYKNVNIVICLLNPSTASSQLARARANKHS